MHYKKNAGFTLIELLVVIAIIGILSGIVLANLNSARAKGSDASLKADLTNLRSQAELYFSDHNNYAVAEITDCGDAGTDIFGNSNFKNGVNAAIAAGGGGASCHVTGGSTGKWAISVPLRTDPTVSFCVDSAGNATTTSATSTVMASTASCQ